MSKKLTIILTEKGVVDFTTEQVNDVEIIAMLEVAKHMILNRKRPNKKPKP